MDDLFSKLAISTVSLVGRAAFGAASRVAVQQISNYLQHGQRHRSQARRDVDANEQLLHLRDRFETKLRIVTPAIDLVEIIAARGNTALESVLELTTTLRRDMDRFARRLADDVATWEESEKHDNKEETMEARATSVARVTRELKALLARIEDAVPFLNLALTTSGANLGTSLPNSVSPSRLMQASSALADCARRFRDEGNLREEWVWPAFDLRFYRMFRGSIRPKSLKDSTWIMEMARCTGRVARVPGGEAAAAASSNPGTARVSTSDGLDYVYDLVLEEDFNDGLYHEELVDRDESNDDTEIRGREWRIPVEEVERLYYSSSGRLLEIEGARHPVLVLKVVKGAGRMRSAELVCPSTPPAVAATGAHGSIAEPANVEWYAIELYQEGDMVGDATDEEDEEEEEEEEQEEKEATSSSASSTNSNGTSNTKLEEASPFIVDPAPLPVHEAAKPTAAAMIGTLSLLEFMVRLSALEVCLQRSHLEAPDEMINLFLRDDHVSKDMAESNATPISTPRSSARRANRTTTTTNRLANGHEMSPSRRSPHASPSSLPFVTTPKRNELIANAYATPLPMNGKHVIKVKQQQQQQTTASSSSSSTAPLLRPPKPPNFNSSDNSSSCSI
ncbi:RanGTP-binding protein-domain-containing protein [Syncephalis plumigaleata]|nr:RanGTP-binding protein-domain-containing protein [Syncephalis plumigaleata]